MSKSKAVFYTKPNSPNQDERIEQYLNQLGLEGMLPYFKNFAEENIKKHGTPKDYIEKLLEKYRLYKKNGRIKSRIIKAGFGQLKALETFNFKAKIKIDQRQIYDLASCSFINEMKTIIFLGQSGVGKTHLSKALATKAIEQECYDVKFIEVDKIIDHLLFKYTDIDSQKRFFDSLVRPDLLVLDEVKYREATPEAQEFLYRLIHQRYECKSTIFTSNKDFSEWEKLFGNYAEEALDRIQDKKYLILIPIEGESYRVQSQNKPKSNGLVTTHN